MTAATDLASPARVTGLPDGLVMRGLAVGELASLVALEALVWGWQADGRRADWLAEFLEPGHTIGVFQGGELVAAHGMTALKLTVPGGQVLDFAGFTFLLVHPLLRGRGLMSALTLHGLDLAIRDGRMPAGGGMPHHSRTHLRYGSGVATRYANVEIGLDGQRELRGVTDDGRLELLGHDAALGVMHEVSAQLSGVRNGWVPRARCTDRYRYSGSAGNRARYGPMVFAGHRKEVQGSGSGYDGFLSYRQCVESDSHGRPRGALQIDELFATSPQAEAQLWRHCFANPLVSSVTASRRPVRDPIIARLTDPRGWRQTVRDDMIVYLLDVPAALAARRYSRDDTVILEVHQPDGDRRRYALDGGLDGARCEPAGRAPDIGMPATALCAAYLGDVSLAELAAAGQVEEYTAGSLRRASAMFSWSPAPLVQDTF
ncbi:MAG TPA: GNAT family N-acetyltransferase [Streptosporangiaceae bacterium]|nr:GNAT family N-acetyltransferase [Streptosporangiaceae bacterium]